MTLDILYFAWVREAIGTDGETLDIPDGLETVDAVIGWLAARGGGYAQALGDRTRIRAALNQVFVAPDARIVDEGELAIFPPVTGG